MAALPNSNSGLAVYQVVDENFNFIYNTMTQIDIEQPDLIPLGKMPNATRIVPRLFYVSKKFAEGSALSD